MISVKKMKRKIYTYTDPYNIDNSINSTNKNIWQEIKDFPHFCVSQTLVEGMKSKYGRKSFDVITTIDSFIKECYPFWTQDPQYKILQYNSISKAIDNIRDDRLRSSFKFNQREIMDSIRFLLELKIKPKDINREAVSREQKTFLSIYKEIYREEHWSVLNDNSISYGNYEPVRKALENILSLEKNKIDEDIEKTRIRRFKKSKESLSNYIKSLLDSYNKNKKIESVVFHGVHQFTPLILRFIEELETLGIEVIFLINYNPNYQKVYKTWKHVYSWIDNDIEFDKNGYQGQKLGEAIGNIIEGNIVDDIAVLKETTKFLKFDNLTTFADYVANIFNKASKKQESLIGGFDEEYGTAAISRMDEQFYAPVNTEINELLKAYFPKQFGEKHFLSYPIGQFILGLYNMWDQQEKKIIYREDALRECLSINFFKKEDMPSPIEIFDKIKLYFNRVSDMEEFMDCLDHLKTIIKERVLGDLDDKYQDLSLYSFYSLSYREISYFNDVMNSLLEISSDLFFSSSNPGFVNYEDHYKKLIEIITDKSQSAEVIDEKELELIERVKLQFDSIEKLKIEGSIEDLKETLHFYLHQREDDDSANWIVRNFEQIDGGVMLNKSHKEQKTYHLALLSNDKMKFKTNDLLPWPLTEKFFSKYNSINNTELMENIGIIMTSMREYGNFLRYSLFYASYHLDCDICLSFIERSDGEEELPYFILKMLGLTAKEFDYKQLYGDNHDITESSSYLEYVLEEPPVDLRDTDLSTKEFQLFKFCPSRFVLNYLIGSIYYKNEYHVFLAFRSLLLKNSWKKLAGKSEDMVEKIVDRELEDLKIFFPFWSEITYIDIRNKIVEQLKNNIEYEKGNYIIKDFDQYYTDIKLNFLVAQVKIDWDDDQNLIKNLHYLSLEGYKDNRVETRREISKYLKEIKEKYPENSAICEFCDIRELCLYSYREGDNLG